MPYRTKPRARSMCRRLRASTAHPHCAPTAIPKGRPRIGRRFCRSCAGLRERSSACGRSATTNAPEPDQALTVDRNPFKLDAVWNEVRTALKVLCFQCAADCIPLEQHLYSSGHPGLISRRDLGANLPVTRGQIALMPTAVASTIGISSPTVTDMWFANKLRGQPECVYHRSRTLYTFR